MGQRLRADAAGIVNPSGGSGGSGSGESGSGSGGGSESGNTGGENNSQQDDTETETVSLEDADANDDGVYSEEELAALTKAQLLELAETLEVGGVSSSNTKAQIIAAILAAQEAAADQTPDPDDQTGT